MWEAHGNQIEFENDLIASTNFTTYTNKQLMRYECDYFREPQVQKQGQLPRQVLSHLRNLYF